MGERMEMEMPFISEITHHEAGVHRSLQKVSLEKAIWSLFAESWDYKVQS